MDNFLIFCLHCSLLNITLYRTF